MNAITLTCIQCDSSFEYTVEEQRRHDSLGFDAPRRCPLCRKHKIRDSDFAPPGRRLRDKKRDYRLKYELQDR